MAADDKCKDFLCDGNRARTAGRWFWVERQSLPGLDGSDLDGSMSRSAGAGKIGRAREISGGEVLPGLCVTRRLNVFQLRRKALTKERRVEAHHHVYVVLLRPEAGRLRRVQRENPLRRADKPCVYVGMTGLNPEERLSNHLSGLKAAWVVTRYGVRLLPELYAHLNPMPFDAAVVMERDLAEDLRNQGYTVTGGH
jgi:hypothetical protein